MNKILTDIEKNQLKLEENTYFSIDYVKLRAEESFIRKHKSDN